ncbi:uncharacterized protein LOC116350193 isoform X1 [Contarinia nasturtii]|uniref:uncharacterized protein LOC116350034 isoform X1 n=1 Tax=Contarinia nasturtii TaxID=265458 RepID=UPI0012D3CEB9|nr:uncharacterized protein LOC116350034 isoform X1 [Contarinia nasturtii]XP_031637793.1 uncharacterized protein LOC116350193 isoform X1 [Contarinia nasturtii]
MSGVEDVFKGVADPMFVGGIKCDLNLQTLEVEQCVLKMHASMHAWQQQSFRHVRFIVQIVIDEIKQIVKNGLFVQLLKKEGFTCKMDSPILLVAYKQLESPPVINHAIVDNVEHQVEEQTTSTERPEIVRPDDSSSPDSTGATWGSNTITESGSIVDSRQSEFSGISGLSSVTIPHILGSVDFSELFDGSAAGDSGDGDNIE